MDDDLDKEVDKLKAGGAQQCTLDALLNRHRGRGLAETKCPACGIVALVDEVQETRACPKCGSTEITW